MRALVFVALAASGCTCSAPNAAASVPEVVLPPDSPFTDITVEEARPVVPVPPSARPRTELAHAPQTRFVVEAAYCLSAPDTASGERQVVAAAIALSYERIDSTPPPSRSGRWGLDGAKAHYLLLASINSGPADCPVVYDVAIRKRKARP